MNQRGARATGDVQHVAGSDTRCGAPFVVDRDLGDTAHRANGGTRHQTLRGAALGDVLGRTRATLLAQLDLPMSTTQIAAALELSAPTLNVHLRTLRDARILWPAATIGCGHRVEKA